MTYDLLIRNGRIVDGSGMPAYLGDVGVRDGLIVEVGGLDGAAHRTIDALGLVIAPGFIDNHCHYDAQVTWDPLCTFSCYHGVTTVLFVNCSVALAPAREEEAERRWLSQLLPGWRRSRTTCWRRAAHGRGAPSPSTWTSWTGSWT